MSVPTRILLLKSPPMNDPEEPDAFAQAFEDSPQFRAQPLSALQFRYVNQDELGGHLSRQDYDGMILTSVRAVRSVWQCLTSTGTPAEHWAGKPIFVVGPQSGESVRQLLGWPQILGQEGGNAERLVGQILDRPRAGQRFLFPAGQLKGDILPQRLKEAGVHVEVITCYRTEENPELRSSLVQFGQAPDLMVIFSPSGLKFALPIMKSLGWDWERIKYVALGPSTAQCIRDHGLPVLTTPAQPTPQDLLNSLLKYNPRVTD